MSQVQAIRQEAGLLERFPRAVLGIRGADRCTFLHGLVSNDIKGLLPGQGRQACLLDRQGKIKGLFIVHGFPEELRLEMDPSFFSETLHLLSKYQITEEVRFEKLTDRYRIIALHGPRVPEILSKTWPAIRLPEGDLQHLEGPPSSSVRWVVRWNLSRLPGIHLWVETDAEVEVRNTLLSAGQTMGLELISEEAFETFRIEAGVPWPQKEISETVILNELGQEDWVSATKGCFVGQEIVARIKHRAHPPRLLTGFLINASESPPRESSIELDGKEVGIITSACFSPTLHRVIAMGFLKYGVEAPHFTVRTPLGTAQAAVTPLPFVKT